METWPKDHRAESLGPMLESLSSKCFHSLTVAESPSFLGFCLGPSQAGKRLAFPDRMFQSSINSFYVHSKHHFICQFCSEGRVSANQVPKAINSESFQLRYPSAPLIVFLQTFRSIGSVFGSCNSPMLLFRSTQMNVSKMVRKEGEQEGCEVTCP